MKYIKLTQNKRAIVDDVDYEWLSQWKWHARKHPRSAHLWYAARTTPTEGSILMHRELLGLKKGDKLDGEHKNGNSLDNRRDNLRTATRSQNMANLRYLQKGTSTFKGVSRIHNSHWGARIEHKGQQIFIGSFVDETEAARAYDARALELNPHFAATNKALGLL